MPSAGDFDPDRYREQVLEPARRLGGLLPADLLLRYAVPAETENDTEAFADHVRVVLRHWRALKQRRVYQTVASGLLAAHADLVAAGRLSYADFARSRDEEQAAVQASLTAMVSALAAGTSLVARSTVPLLCTALGGSLSEAAVEEALAEHGITVVDQVWSLPPEPPANVRSALASNLRILGLQLAADAVFGTEAVRAGFRLRSGFRLTSGDRITGPLLGDLRRQGAKRALDERKTARDNVLAALGRSAHDQQLLDGLLLWQLVDVLRPQIVAGLPIRAIASAAGALGLDRAEAAELALALTDQVATRDPVRNATQQALDAGRLLTARKLVHTLPETDDLRRRVMAEADRFDVLVGEADAARERGATEIEAELITKALGIAQDAEGDLRPRLWSLPAPAPAQANATVKDDRVHLEWLPGPARTGGIRYRVVRTIGAPGRTPGAGTVIAETTELQADDHGPPPGEILYYSVFAARGGDVWSAGTVAPEPVVVLPEVREPVLETREGSVLGSWRLPLGAADVVVTCRPDELGEASAQEWPIASTRVGFLDAQVTAAIRYRYRIHTVYLGSDGQRRVSSGVVRRVTPETPMDPVAGLGVDIVAGDDPRLVLAWTTPARGSVTIYRHHQPPPWRPGTAVPLDELSRHGRPVSATTEAGTDGTSRITADHQDGRSFFTAVTVGKDRGLVGPTVSVASASPVGRLRASRSGTRGRLQWDWPEGAHRCRISWTTDPETAGSGQFAECGQRQYHDDGGFEIEVDERPTTVSVVTVRRDADGEIVSPPVTVTVPGQEVTVGYSFQRRSPWTPWRPTRLLLRADRSCRIPPLTVVRSPGRVLPLRAESGTPILRLPELDLSPSAPFSVTVPEPAGTGESRLACFFAGSAPAGITLVAESRS
jgi:hypothetical protein